MLTCYLTFLITCFKPANFFLSSFTDAFIKVPNFFTETRTNKIQIQITIIYILLLTDLTTYNISFHTSKNTPFLQSLTNCFFFNNKLITITNWKSMFSSIYSSYLLQSQSSTNFDFCKTILKTLCIISMRPRRLYRWRHNSRTKRPFNPPLIQT